MNSLYFFILILIGFSSGVIISGAVFAFITALGVVQRLAKKTSTERFFKLYEEIIIFGGIFGTSTGLINYHITITKFFVAILSFLIGVFYGCLAMSLAEMLNVIPILIRRGNLKSGLKFFILSIAFGKLIGSILYYCVSGFYKS